MRRACAYFDMDGTLVQGSTVGSYLAWLRELGIIRRRDLPRVLGYSVQRRLGLRPERRAYEWLARRMAGRAEAEVAQEGREWFDHYLKPRLAPVVVGRLEEHRQRGDRVAVLTGSSPYVSGPMARHLGIPDEDLLCTRVEVRNGRLTGRLVEPPCLGEGKVAWARRHATAHDCDLSRSAFYGDSIDDLAILSEVGYPCVVAPDRALAAEALRRSWPVLDLR